MGQPRTALVTGAASGIGAAIAQRFLQEGYSVALFDLDIDGCRRVADKVATRDNYLLIQGDAGEEQSIREAVIQAEAAFGAIGALINNVGIEINDTVLDQSREQWDRQLSVNLTSVFLFSKYCIPSMRKQGGAIVNISSLHAYLSWPRCAAYDATKAGMLGVTRALAVDHGADGIRVNAVCPGYVRTPLLEQWFASIENGEQKATLCHPLRRIGEPVDIANAVYFLASEQASFITGAVLTVDGGLMAVGQ